jgi:hypothetical protein
MKDKYSRDILLSATGLYSEPDESTSPAYIPIIWDLFNITFSGFMPTSCYH